MKSGEVEDVGGVEGVRSLPGQDDAGALGRVELGEAIHAAVQAGDVARCEALLSRHRGCGSDPVLGPWLGAALCEAAGAGSTELVLLLLRARADVRFTDGASGRRAIHHAVLSGDTDIIQHLLMAGSPINVVDAAGKTPVHHAVESKQLGVVRYLLDKGASLRCRAYQEDESPLHVVARLGYTEICRALLTRAGNLNVKSRRDTTALTLAVKEKHYTIVNLLCEAGANIEVTNEKGQTPLLIAVELSSAEMCRKLLSYGADPNARDLRGRTGLHYLAMAPASDAKLELAKLMVAAGMQNVQQEDVDRYTPLHYTAFRGHIALAELLIAFGADVNKFYAWRLDTPLNMAISNRQHAMVRYLVERGVDVTQVDGPLSRVTALHKVMLTRFPVAEEKVSLIQLLISHGARLNALTAREHTPLEDCVFYSTVFRHSPLPLLLPLLSAGAKPAQGLIRTRSDPQSSPLCWLAWHGSEDAARFLVSAGWNLATESWIWLPGRDSQATHFLSWLQTLARTPQSLLLLCRGVIRKFLVEEVTADTDISPVVWQLPLPGVMKRFLLLEPEMKEFSPAPIEVKVA